MRSHRFGSAVRKSTPALLIGAAGSLFNLAVGGGPAALMWAGCALIVLAVVLTLTEQILDHRRVVRETRRGAARDAAASTLGTAAAAGQITSSEAVTVLDAQSRREAVITGLAAGADPAELAKLVRALRNPEAV